MFLSFDGVDGAGKSTQIARLRDWLEGRGCEVVVCRDPGGTELGEKLRSLLLDRHDTPIHVRSEMLLYMTARCQMVEEVIRPALACGKVVVSDRYLLANIVYQGYAGGLAIDDVRRVGQVATGGLSPDLTLVLDMPTEAALRRLGREPDRMESRGVEYLEQVRRGFLSEVQKSPRQITVINADQPADAVEQEIRSAVQTLIDSRLSK